MIENNFTMLLVLHSNFKEIYQLGKNVYLQPNIYKVSKNQSFAPFELNSR